MDFLKKFFPFSFKNLDTTSNFVIGIIIYAVVAIVAGVVIGISSAVIYALPGGNILSPILSALCSLIDLYTTAGIVIRVLAYTKVIK